MTALEEMIREAGESWLIESFPPPDTASAHLAGALVKVEREYRRRFGGEQPVITPEALVSAYRRNAHKVRAFLQALGATQNPVMLVMFWRVLLGSSIARIRMDYLLEKHFRLVVTLVTPFGQDEGTYESDDIDDLALLRHLGIMKMDGRPILDGFYPLNLGA